ncbi:MAG: hypothetical protein VKK62_07345 [Synechococcaceae cyanobacterium]|nr:hypothetical protein [Synechococcaceae cyanobacterium]
MIVLKVTNSSEVIASKMGKLLGMLTPDAVESHLLESILLHKLVEHLAAEGISGEVASVHGLDLNGSQLVLEDRLHVQNHRSF